MILDKSLKVNGNQVYSLILGFKNVILTIRYSKLNNPFSWACLAVGAGVPAFYKFLGFIVFLGRLTGKC